MEGTVERVRDLFEECLEIIGDRDPKYGSQWKKESMEELLGNVSRKYSGLKWQFEEKGKVDLEFPKDLINYTAFFLLRLVDENRGL